MRTSTMSLSEKRYLHHCSVRSEKIQRTWDKLVTLMKKVCCQLSPFSHVQVRGDPSTNQVQTCLKNGNQVATQKKEQILAEVRSEIQKHELQAESDKRSIQELTGIIDSQQMEIDHTVTGCEQSRRDQLLLQEELSEQNRALRETRIKSLHEMEELKRVQELRIDATSWVSRKRLRWNLKKSYCRKCMCHLDHRRRFPVKIIGHVIWILMLQEAVKTSNESNENPILQLSSTGRPVTK